MTLCLLLLKIISDYHRLSAINPKILFW